MPIKASQLRATENLYTVVVPLIFEEKGETKTEEVRIVYRPLTGEVQDELDSLPPEQKGKMKYELPIVVRELPDILNGEGSQKPTVEFFNTLDPRNLAEVYQRIVSDSLPKLKN